MVVDINQSGSRNFRSSSVVYRTQFILDSTVKCAKEILAVIKVSPF